MEALPDDSELVGGSESRFTIRLEANLETLQELHQEVLADWQAGRPNERIMQLLNDRQQELSPGRFVSSTPTRFVTTTNAERQAGQLAETLKGFVKNLINHSKPKVLKIRGPLILVPANTLIPSPTAMITLQLSLSLFF